MSSRTGAEPSAPANFARRGSVALSRLLFGNDEQIAVPIRFGLISMLCHLTAALFYASSAKRGETGLASAAFMIGTNLIGMLAFYPFVRSGLTRRLDDSGLVLPQMVWASFSTVCGMALVPSLRLPLLQVLCMTQAFGLLGLKPRQLCLSGCVALVMLSALFCAGALGYVPGYLAIHEITPTLLTAISLALLTRITIEQSRRRGWLATQTAELREAVAAVHELAIRDALTGLYNRRHMESLLADELARSRASGVPFSVALLDIDHFKRINDAYGHAGGDIVLREFARAVGGSLRSTDNVARWGGEEFLVLAPGIHPLLDETLQEPLQRLRAALSIASADLPAGRPRVTFSAGLSTWRPEESVHQTVARADEALFAAKAAGRDRVIVDEAARSAKCSCRCVSPGIEPCAACRDAENVASTSDRDRAIRRADA